MGLRSKKQTPVIVYNIDDLPQLVLDENFMEAEEVIKREGITIKYGDDNKGRKRQLMTELRDMAFTLQRDMRSQGYDTNYLRDVIKGLQSGSSNY